MKLKKLLKDLPQVQVKGSKEIEISGVCSNSKLVAPGNLFIARKGLADDGTRYIQEALSAGASAILTDIFDPTLQVTQLIYPNVNEIEGAVATHFYQNPSHELFMIGLTGTNGKTTTSFLIKYLLDKLDGPTGLIGTIEYIVGEHRYNATRTTPDVVSNHKMLREMVLQNCKSAVMEVTSHALDQGRVQNVDFDVAVFTNFTLDHLDYHQTMENYCAAKNKLFRMLDPKNSKKKKPGKKAIVNADSPWMKKMIEGCVAPLLTYGIESPADLKAENIRLSASGTEFDLVYQGKTYACVWPLAGRFNIYNCLAAIGVGVFKGHSIEKIVDLLKTFPSVPGRLQQVVNPLNLKIYVDFAHSDDALQNVYECLQEFKTGKIITVFGCGGERDKTKRPKMARVAEEFSDVCIVTSDNPRSEDPDSIISEIFTGFKHPEKHFKATLRQDAIDMAVKMATPDDIILIAGKGHETTQMFAHKTIEFDDRKVALQACQKHSLVGAK